MPNRKINIRKLIENILYSILVLSLSLTIAIVAWGTHYVNQQVLSIKSINSTELQQNPNSEIYADDGTTLIWTDAEYQHRPSNKENTPEILIEILLAVEDKTFYSNNGYSEKAILNMVYTTIKDKIQNTHNSRGGSTITQQLVKNTRYLNTNISVYDRKIQEIALSKKLTEEFSKEEILFAYLNKVGFLESSYGFNTAMYLLYGEETSLEKVDVKYIAKYATIVGMLQNPSIYNPRTNPEATEKRRNVVLKIALDDGLISKKDYKEAIAIPINEGLKDQGWFTQQVYQTASANGSYVNSILSQLEEYGYDIKSKENPVKVVSNLNIAQNEWLQAEVSNPEHYANERQQIAVTVVEPQTGKVLAQVGSRYGSSPYDLNRATQVTRSSGSTIKPFLSYAPLIEFGNVDENTIWNGNTTTYAGTDVTVYNYGRLMYGQQSTTNALKWSLNTPAVEALTQQEPWMNQTIMSNLGLEDHLLNNEGVLESVTTFSGSQALGIHESAADFASAFGALADNGKSKRNMYVKSVTQNGETTELSNKAKQAMSPRTASKILKMLETTLEPDGSARTAPIPEFGGYAVKTGTVGFDENQPLYYDKEHNQYAGLFKEAGYDYAASDQWMAGTTKSVAIAVWTGFDDQAIVGDWLTPDNQSRASILVNAMRYFNQGKDTSQFGFDQTRLELNKKEEQNTAPNINVPKYNLVSSESMLLPTVKKNDVIATKDQEKIYSDFLNDQLSEEYQSIRQFYESSNTLGYALYKMKLDNNTTFYQINQDGVVVSE